jgi:hypothetical protein
MYTDRKYQGKTPLDYQNTPKIMKGRREIRSFLGVCTGGHKERR